MPVSYSGVTFEYSIYTLSKYKMEVYLSQIYLGQSIFRGYMALIYTTTYVPMSQVYCNIPMVYTANRSEV